MLVSPRSSAIVLADITAISVLPRPALSANRNPRLPARAASTTAAAPETCSGRGILGAGLPPLSGFVAKFSLFHALLNPPDGPIPAAGWALMTLILAAGLVAVLSMMRFGVRTFWASRVDAPPRLQRSEVLPVVFLLGLTVFMTVEAGPIFGYLGRTSEGIHRPADYIARVLGQPPVASAVEAK